MMRQASSVADLWRADGDQKKARNVVALSRAPPPWAEKAGSLPAAGHQGLDEEPCGATSRRRSPNWGLTPTSTRPQARAKLGNRDIRAFIRFSQEKSDPPATLFSCGRCQHRSSGKALPAIGFLQYLPMRPQSSFAMSRRRNFWILPVEVFGTSVKTTWRGHLYDARCSRHQLITSFSARSRPGLSSMKAQGVSPHFLVRFGDNGTCGDVGMLVERFLHLDGGDVLAAGDD